MKKICIVLLVIIGVFTVWYYLNIHSITKYEYIDDKNIILGDIKHGKIGEYTILDTNYGLLDYSYLESSKDVSRTKFKKGDFVTVRIEKSYLKNGEILIRAYDMYKNENNITEEDF